MMPASMAAMPRCCVPVAVVAFPASARPGDRRNVRFFRPAAACGGDEQQQQPPSMAAVPPSLRALQAKRKLAAEQRGVPRATATSAAGCAVAALFRAVEAVQGAAAGGAAGAVAWVFRKVHFQSPSPDVAIGLLGVFACCLGTAVEAERNRALQLQAKKPEAPANEEPPVPDDDGGEEEEEPEDLPELVEMDMEKELWGRIGILHGHDDVKEGLDEEEIEVLDSARARRRKAAYERVIASGGANSLILSNYAQLLYEFDKDINRAEMYFKQAVAAEPADGEAMRRYGMFLWHARGDMAGAEDMFTNAIEEDPESSHHQSSYAWFLWMTGGVETCLIDSSNKNRNDAAGSIGNDAE